MYHVYVKFEGQGHKSKFTISRGKLVANVDGVTSTEGFLVSLTAFRWNFQNLHATTTRFLVYP